MEFKHLPTTGENLIRLTPNKHIYYILERPEIVVKVIPVKNLLALKNAEREIKILQKARDVCHQDRIPFFVPEFYESFMYDEVCYILMERIEGKTLAELYGEEYEDLPKNIQQRIRFILKNLFLNDIHYVDVTPYNFILRDDEEIYIIDFGHAQIVEVNYYLKEFLINKVKSWNPDFE